MYQAAKSLLTIPFFTSVKTIIFLEHTLNINDIADNVWRFSNNVDPKRDYFFIEHSNGTTIIFDGTRKTKAYDGFQRDWPNILASEAATIERIDTVWNKLGLGKFIPSPSLKYAKQLYKGGAVAEE